MFCSASLLSAMSVKDLVQVQKLSLEKIIVTHENYIDIDLSYRNTRGNLTNLAGFSVIADHINQLVHSNDQKSPRSKKAFLYSIDLSYNQLTSLNEPSFIEFVNTHPIYCFNASHNQIKKIPNSLFKSVNGTIPLQKFLMNHNKLEEIPHDFLSQASDLKLVDLLSNNFKKIDMKMFTKNKKLEKIRLGGTNSKSRNHKKNHNHEDEIENSDDSLKLSESL